ncbi:MAG: VC0807 family protein [Acidimicrobiales bacterium]
MRPLSPRPGPGNGRAAIRPDLMALTTVHLPSPRALFRHALPHLVESALGPAALFYGMLWLLGLWGALFAALAWAYLALARRLIARQAVPTMLWLASAVLTARTAVSLVTHSGVIYFLQPTATTFLVAFAFLVSAPLGKPLAERLARDLCPLDPDLLARPCVKRFFLRVSLLWAGVLLSNASATLWLLFTASLKVFVLDKTLMSWSITVAAIAVSVVMFRRTLRGEGIALRWTSAGPGRQRSR